MSTKLTLTVEKSVIEKAKIYAKSKGRSLSDIIENYLKTLTSEENIDNSDLSPLVKSMKGAFKMPEDFDYKKDLTDALSEKYLNS